MVLSTGHNIIVNQPSKAWLHMMNTAILVQLRMLLKQCYSDTRMLFKEFHTVRFRIRFQSILHFSHIHLKLGMR